MHQVETSFLLKPFSKSKDPDDVEREKKREARNQNSTRKKKRILDSESSEEDFFFLESALRNGEELDDVDRRLLAGIV